MPLFSLLTTITHIHPKCCEDCKQLIISVLATISREVNLLQLSCAFVLYLAVLLCANTNFSLNSLFSNIAVRSSTLCSALPSSALGSLLLFIPPPPPLLPPILPPPLPEKLFRPPLPFLL